MLKSPRSRIFLLSVVSPEKLGEAKYRATATFSSFSGADAFGNMADSASDGIQSGWQERLETVTQNLTLRSYRSTE